MSCSALLVDSSPDAIVKGVARGKVRVTCVN